MEDNQRRCVSQVSNLKKLYEAIVSKLNEIKKKTENPQKENMERKNAGEREKSKS